jgi:uncharacterized protein (DUF1919 family)
MFKPNLLQRIIHKCGGYIRPYLAPIKRRKLKNKEFTIVSNNCWGGLCYESYGLRKDSLTVGGYFFPEDYIRFAKNLKYYTSLELKVISASESKHAEQLKKQGNMDKPIGVLDDVEFVFVHYKNSDVAREKWNRRVKRIHWNHLIFKFSYQNFCTKEQLQEFDAAELPGSKFMFVNQPNMGYECGVYYPGFEDDDQVYNDTWYWGKYFDVTKFLNTGGIVKKN